MTGRSRGWSLALLALGAWGCTTLLGDGQYYVVQEGGTSDAGGSGSGSGADATTRDDSAPEGAPTDGSIPGDSALPPDGACPYQDSTDHDGDGFSFAQGDCNDCDPDINPGAYDYVNGIDDDCNGNVDDEPTLCDTSVALASADPLDAARSLGLCRQTTEAALGAQRTWGVVSAAFVSCDGADDCGGAPSGCSTKPNYALGHGNLSHLGNNTPLEGARMLGLSSGTARDPTDPGYQSVAGFDKMYTCTLPPGYPAVIPSCPGVVTGAAHDCAALKLVIRAPTNASSFQFSENFFTYEFPSFVCSEFNDYFVALMTPAPANATSGGNVVFDAQGNPIDVDTNLLQVCDPQTAGGKTYSCPLGSSSLAGTGFGGTPGDAGTGNHAATGWLRTTVPVGANKGKDITLILAVWDSGDGVLDSTALIDAVIWSPAAVTAVSTVAE